MEEQEKKQETVEETVQETAQEVVQEPTVEATEGRPTFLTILCILTFIGSGLGVLSYLLLIVGAGAIMSFLGSMGGATGGGGMAFMVISLVLALASLFGAIQMWKLKKMGFMLYAGANAVALILPYLFGTPFFLTAFMVGLLITGGFIVMYYLNVKHMS